MANLVRQIFFITTIGLCSQVLNAGFKFSGQSSTLQLSGSSASIILDTPLTDFSGTLKILNKSATSLQQSTTSDLITFNNGLYQAGSTNKAQLSATLDPAGSDKIILNSGQRLEAENSSVIENLEVRNTGNSISGQPVFNSPIVLQNSSAEVSLALQSKLNQNITMNGGTVILGDDLTLQDGVFFSGNGTVDVNSKTLVLPPAISSAWSGQLIFLNANDISLSGYTTLTGTWTFSGTGTSHVNGNGNILDISGGGTIAVDPSHTLYLTDVMLKGLGSGSGSLVIDSSSFVKISSTTIELSGSYDLSAGQVVVEGSNSSLIAKNSDTFNITTASAALVVDGVVFLYDPLGSAPAFPSPIVASGGGVVSLINDGVIRSNIFTDGATGNIEFTGTSNVLTNNRTLSPSNLVHIINDTPASPVSSTLNGQGYYLQFNFSNGQYLTVDPNVTLTFENILLKDFDPALINLLGAGASKAKIVFGNNVALSLDKDISLTEALSFSGNGTILGNNNRITLPSTSLITCDGSGNNLLLKDVRIYLENNSAIQCLNSNSSITVQNSSIFMNQAGFNFSAGNLIFSDNVIIDGADTSSPTGSTTFQFLSAGNMTINSSSMLKLCRGINFSYNPDVTGDTVAAGKRHLVMTDPSSVLWMDAATIQSGSMGLAIDFGRLIIDGKSTFNITNAVDAELEFGSSLNVEISPSGIIDIDGALKYTSTTFP